jgi:putative oxidoreductase
MLVAFLVPVTLMMHAFWRLDDPMAIHVQQAMFMKNVALLGAALLASQLGAGALSLDARRAAAPVSQQAEPGL